MIDTNYWNEFYTKNNVVNDASDFCKFISIWFKNKSNFKIVDCGSGNGRDSYYLGKKYQVTGVDSSGHIPTQTKNCNFFRENFCTFDKNEYDLVYSRFTLHAITNEAHEEFLSSITKDGIYLCMEFRSDKDTNAEKVHGIGHYRNYINKDYIKKLLLKFNFNIQYIKEDTGFAPYKGEDPYCIRIIAKKNVRKTSEI